MSHVLVVDDHRDTLEILGRLVQACGYRVTLAASGEEALAALARDAADLVLLDVSMPGMTGIKLLRRIREDPQTQSLPVVMVSAVSHPIVRREAIASGANDYWVKTEFDFAELGPRLDHHIGSR